MIELVFDDILNQDVDAIVNPANSYMLHGGGLARVIARAAGPELIEESQGIGEQLPIPTGGAIITTAGKLPFKAVIHAVGPVWEGDEDAPYWRKNSSDEDPDELLRQAHLNALEVASRWYSRTEPGRIASIAFPAISCGVFRFPVERAAPIAVAAVREAQERFEKLGIAEIKVRFCVLDEWHYKAFDEALKCE